MSATKQQIRKFERLVSQLDDLISEIRKDEPMANGYLEAGGGFLLLKNSSHDENGRWRGVENVIAREQTAHLGGGGI